MSYMAKVYANLICKGEKTLEEIPERLRNEVQQLLNQDVKEND